MSYEFSCGTGNDKVFLVNFSEASGKRLDPFYYLPSVVALEKKICDVSSMKLRDFSFNMAGGATPSKAEAETHYTKAEDGVPFIRVQNLSTTGKLNLEDCRKITRETHETLLLRSQLSGGELLVKITGVGRMAVASVVPENFEGNINQHLVAIQTGSQQTSEAIAAYLNLDIAERLASRRSTGGTRPALDYPALLSLPIVFDERIPKLINAAVECYESKSAQAKTQLAGIDALLLRELGITSATPPPDSVANRCFIRQFSEVTGERLDPIANQPKRLAIEKAIRNGKYPVQHLYELVEMPKVIVNEIESNMTYIGMENIDGLIGEFIKTSEKESISSALCFSAGQIIFPKLRPYLNKTHLAQFDGICSTEFHIFEAKEIDARFLTEFLRFSFTVALTQLLMTGTTLPRLQMQDIEHLEIPLPPRAVQDAIVVQIEALRASAKSLFAQAQAELDEAKTAIEAMILGE